MSVFCWVCCTRALKVKKYLGPNWNNSILKLNNLDSSHKKNELKQVTIQQIMYSPNALLISFLQDAVWKICTGNVCVVFWQMNCDSKFYYSQITPFPQGHTDLAVLAVRQ